MNIWKRKEEIRQTGLGLVSHPPMPANTKYETMFEMLRNAEAFSHGEKKVESQYLKNLIEYIDNYLAPSKDRGNTNYDSTGKALATFNP